MKRSIDAQFARSPKLSLQLCGAIAELMGLTGQLLTIPASSIAQVPTPALIPWQDTFAVLYKASDRPTHMRRMYANLMGASCFEIELN